MFGIVDRATYEIKVFLLITKTKRNSIAYSKKNIYSICKMIHDNKDINHVMVATKIYTDCWQSYQGKDFNEMGFILHKVNHSICLGKGSFHINTIEGGWFKINNFSGLNGNVINKFSLQGIDLADYFNDWIFTALIFIKTEHLAFAENKKRISF